MTRRCQAILQALRLLPRDGCDRRHAAEELVVVRDFLDALRADAPAAQHVREKRADVVEALRSAERDDENGIEGRQLPSAYTTGYATHGRVIVMAMTHTRLALVAALLVIGLVPLAAQDWPQWRGPARDGLIRGFKEPANWPKELTKRWNVEIGPGYATPLVVGERLYVFTRQGDDEVMAALDAAIRQSALAHELSGAVQDEPGDRAAWSGPEVDTDVCGESALHARYQRHRHSVRRHERQADLAATTRRH